MEENNSLNHTEDQPAREEQVDGNQNANGAGGAPQKENPLKRKGFYAAYLITLFAIVGFTWLISGGEWMLAILFLCVPYAILGILLWGIGRNADRPVALGILFGSITPFVAVFLMTGGCGLLMF